MLIAALEAPLRFPRLDILIPLVFSTLTLSAQTAPGPQGSIVLNTVTIPTANGTKVISITRADGAEGIYIPPIARAPFSATVFLSSSTGMDSNTGHSYSYVARDSAGRISIEGRTIVYSREQSPCYSSSDFCDDIGKPDATPALIDRIYIDPVQHTYYDCTTKDRLCHSLPYQSAIINPVANPVHPLAIGQKKIDGLQAIGTRETITTVPFQKTDEVWYSPDLQIELSSKRSSPNKSRSVQVKSLKHSEPSSKLFALPSGYKIVATPPPPPPPVDPLTQQLIDALRDNIEKSH